MVVSSFELKPYVSVGNIIFGESRETVREKNGEFREFKKSKFSKNTTDDFSKFHVYYDKDNKVEAVEFFGECSVVFNEVDLFSKTFDELKKIFEDESNEEDESGIIFKKFGFSIYSPEKNKAETILAFKKGYYD